MGIVYTNEGMGANEFNGGSLVDDDQFTKPSLHHWTVKMCDQNLMSITMTDGCFCYVAAVAINDQ